MNYTKCFFESFDQVVCLNIQTSKHRREYIKGLFEENGINLPLFFHATGVEDEVVSEYYKSELVTKYPPCFRCGKMKCGNPTCNNILIKPQVANFISYLNVWKYIKNNNIRTALIIEDDIAFSSDINEKCQQIIEDKLIQLTRLDGEEPTLIRFGWGYGDDHKKISPVQFIPNLLRMSNPCHAINEAMAEKLLMEFHSINTTSDIYTHQHTGLSVNNYTSLPPLFFENSWSTGEFDSLIHPKQVRLDYLEKVSGKYSREYLQALNNFERHVKHIYSFQFLVVGHPRCGSGYMSQLFKLNGFDVGHEEMGSEGISSWMFAVDDDPYPYYQDNMAARRSDKYFNYLICHVRNPIDAVPSIARDNLHSENSYEFRRKHIKEKYSIDLNSFETNFERAVASYVFWYQIILEQSPNIIIRIEEDQKELRLFLKKNKKISPLRFWWRSPKSKVNSNKMYQGMVYEKEQYLQEDWLGLPEILINGIRGICQRVGYKSPLAGD